MKITRRFTTAGTSPYDLIEFRRATSEIKNPDGSIVFRLEGFMVPAQWSQVAADILAQKYFRKAGVARRLKKVEETQIPSWAWRSIPDEKALAELLFPAGLPVLAPWIRIFRTFFFMGVSTLLLRFAAPTAGTYHVSIRAYATFSGVTLTPSYTP